MNRESLEHLRSPGITADDVLVVMANTDLETAARLDWWSMLPFGPAAAWSMGFLTRSGDLVEELEDHDDDWWEQNWGGRA